MSIKIAIVPASHAPQGSRYAYIDCPQRTTIACPEGLWLGDVHLPFTGQRLWTREGTDGRTPAGPTFIVFTSSSPKRCAGCALRVSCRPSVNRCGQDVTAPSVGVYSTASGKSSPSAGPTNLPTLCPH